MAKVSVIIPNYNHASYLQQRIDSVLNQTFQDFEVILLDDASTDGSQDLLKLYEKHPKVSHLIFSQVNSGSPFKSWKKGIELSRGTYVWIAESDDFADLDFLKFTVAILDAKPSAGLTFTNSVIVDGQGNETLLLQNGNRYQIPFDKPYCILNHDLHFFSYYVHDLVIGNASSVLFRRQLLTQVDQDLMSTFKNAGDLYVYLSMALQSDIIFTNKPLNYFRKHVANTTKLNAANGFLYQDRVRILTQLSGDLLSFKDSDKELQLFLKRHYLVCSDFGFIPELKALLKVLHKHDVLTGLSYWHLRGFCFFKLIVAHEPPYFYRKFIKKQLESL
ncbi:glycosyltransferase family 2 protein [Mangrovimonas xylaniphaga]|uniref:glycosyltransferase family 2 protein n=1 Tax=Mangrovimonas xylaniphaga TaxID=1645915 RepID=UPI0006B641A2|nr:glycosyltransferase family A protein [Mangrovimonas xylaniphaga]